MAGERLGERADRGREHAPEVRVVLGEADPAAGGGGRRPHRQPRLLGQRDRRVPAAARVDVPAGDEDGVRGRHQPLRQRAHERGVGARAPVDRARGLVADGVVVDLRAPVVHRDRDEHRALRRQRGEVGRAREGVRDVLGPRRLVAPLDERVRHARGVAVGQQRLQRHQRARLLARGDHERGLVGLRGEDRAHRVADPGGGVEVDERGAAARLRVAVGHPDRRALMEAEHVAEVRGEVGEERQLGRAGVAEHRGHAASAQHLEGGFANRGHGRAAYGYAKHGDPARSRRPAALPCCACPAAARRRARPHAPPHPSPWWRRRPPPTPRSRASPLPSPTRWRTPRSRSVTRSSAGAATAIPRPGRRPRP